MKLGLNSNNDLISKLTTKLINKLTRKLPLAKSSFVIVAFSYALTGCGGGSEETPTPSPEKSVIGITTVTELAIEKSNQLAKFNIQRSGATTAINISYSLNGSSDSAKGSATQADYQLIYSDGGNVGTTIELGENQNTRVIEVHPIQDNLHEVPEALTLTITNGTSYTIAAEKSAQISITDASNSSENAKVFLGTFSAQGDAITSATGVLSLILQGDNEQAKLNYTFSDLGAIQTDQHIHLAPAGSMIKDIEFTGTVSDYQWDLAPGGIFTTEQQMLDTLFEGKFFVNIHTADYQQGEISAAINYDANVEPPADTPITEAAVDRDIIRFLNQATFGATPEEYQTLRDKIDSDGGNRIQVYSAWLEQQFAKPQTSLLALTDASITLFGEESESFSRRDAFWPVALYGNDQLRQRIALALSEILVIGDNNNIVRKAHRGVAHYWDQLASNAFSSYRKTLEDASLHPVMGIWLSHLRNQKTNLELGYYPDENYAREIMQLFTFGLVHRQKNGAIKLGEDNLPIATYDNEVIKEMAKVFTGLSFSYKNNETAKVDNNYFLLGNATNDYQYRWTEPMKFFADQHEFGAKTLFNDNGNTVTIPANSEETAEEAKQELSQVLDALVSHQTTAPFISRKLIQRLVTSNPSADYIERVANAFGQTGDLKAVIRAILLDKEARNPNVVTSTTFGKMKEPILQMTALMRLFNASSKIPLGAGTNGLNLAIAEQYSSNATLLRVGELYIGQRVLGSPSVFNFFLPDFAPTGKIASQSLVAPELQLLTETQLFITLNTYHKLLSKGFLRSTVTKNSEYTTEQATVQLNPAQLTTLWQQTEGDNTVKATALVDYLDFYLNAGQLKASDNQSTRQTLIETLAATEEEQRIKLALYGASAMPEFMVQR